MAEAEIRLAENHTVGAGGSFFTFSDGDPGDIGYQDDEYASFNVFYRYYPTASFRGFFIGVQGGTVSVTSKTNDSSPSGVLEESGTAISAVRPLALLDCEHWHLLGFHGAHNKSE